MAFYQKLLGKAYFIFKMTGPATIRPVSSDFWKALGVQVQFPRTVLTGHLCERPLFTRTHASRCSRDYVHSYLAGTPGVNTTSFCDGSSIGSRAPSCVDSPLNSLIDTGYISMTEKSLYKHIKFHINWTTRFLRTAIQSSLGWSLPVTS